MTNQSKASKQSKTRKAIAKDPGEAPERLDELMARKVREAIAKNPNTPPKIMEKLIVTVVTNDPETVRDLLR
jgi:hypothetical protein